MVGVVIATHGSLCTGLMSAIELIIGQQSQVETVSLCHGDGIDEFHDRVNAAIEKADSGNGVIGFVDFLGGSPANCML